MVNGYPLIRTIFRRQKRQLITGLCCIYLRAGKVWEVDAGQFFAVPAAEVRADERGLEEGGAGGGEDHLVRPDAVGGSVVAASEFDERTSLH